MVIAIVPVILVFLSGLSFWSFQLPVQSGTIRSFYHVFLKWKNTETHPPRWRTRSFSPWI